MPLVLLEDLKPLADKRRLTFIYSIRIVRPFVKLARLTVRNSRLIFDHAVSALQAIRPEKVNDTHASAQRIRRKKLL